MGRGGTLMVSALQIRSGPVSSTDRGHHVVFLGKTLYSHRAFFHPDVSMGNGKFNAEGGGGGEGEVTRQ